MRVFICGAQGTGKSTLVNNFPEKNRLKKKDSFSSDFLEKDPTVQRSSSEGYNEFQDKILLYCLNEYVNDNDFISSRSIIDSYAYLKVNASENTVPLFNLLTHYKDYLLREDDIYIYLPIEFPLTAEGNENRDIDIEYQAKVDKYMKKYFEALRGKRSRSQFITLTGTLGQRIEKLEEIITKTREKCSK